MIASMAGAMGFSILLPRMMCSSAVSTAGKEVACQASAIYRLGTESMAVFGRISEAMEELADVVEEASVAGWDGLNAPPVPLAAHDRAKAFLRALPDHIALPSFAVEPDDGSLSLEWAEGYRKVFSISIGRSPRLAFAGLDGSDKWHGVASFDGIVIPQQILRSIQQISA